MKFNDKATQGRRTGGPATAKLNDGTDGEWGAGWPILQAAPTRQVAGIGGARAAFFVYPDERLAIVALTNLAGANPQRFIPKIAEFYRNPKNGA